MATDRPLDGVRVLDLTTMLAGPYCCYQLALMGAEVIKVERPGGGDPTRGQGPDADLNAAGMGVDFLAQNGGKRSVTIDLETDAGADLFRQLALTADVVVETFRPGVMAGLGLSAERLRDEDPDLIYCAVTGFGQTGPWAGRPAADGVVQSLAGVMSVTGDGRPAPVGFPIAETLGGMAAAFAIAAALNARPRGAVLDISMTEAVLSVMGPVISDHLASGEDPADGDAAWGIFATREGLLTVSAEGDAAWRALADHLGRSDLADHPDYATSAGRTRNRASLRDAVETALAAKPAEDWARELTDLSVPAAEVLSVPEALASAHIVQRGLVADLQAAGQTLAVMASPVVSGGARPRAAAPPPRLGADNRSIFAALGLETSQIDDLARRGVI